MPRLINLSVKQFSFLVGDLECSKYIQDFNISIPLSQYNTECIWRGSFTIRFIKNLATADGLIEDQFSEETNPSYWRDGQKTVIININGFSLPQLVIRDYNYDSQSMTGEGQLTQLIDLFSFERPGEEIPDTEFGQNTELAIAIKNLIVNAGKLENTFYLNPAKVIIPNTGEYIPIKIASRTSLNDAQTYAGSVGRFIYQDLNGDVRTVLKPDLDASPLFFRSKSEIIPESGNKPINFAAEKVQVIGSRQVAKKNDSDVEPNEDDGIDDKGRPKYLRTITKKQLGELFPEQLPGNTTEVVVGVKEIFYRYEDDKSIINFEPSKYVNITPIVLDAITQYPFQTSGLKRGDKTVQTITIEQGIVAEIFSSDLPDALEIPGLPRQPARFEKDFAIPSNVGVPSAYFGFLVKSILVETEIFRWNFQPKGIKFPDFPFDFFYQKFPLVLDRREDLRTTLPGKTVLYGKRNPLTGKAQELEKDPEKEDRQPKPEYDFDTETIKGEYQLSPNGWNTFYPKVYQENFDYLPSQQWANILARKIGIREYGRRDGKYFTIPIPMEWLIAGCPLFAVADIDSGRYVIENPQIVFQDGKAVFRFFGEKLATIPAIAVTEYPVFIPTGNLQIVPNAGIVARVGYPVNALQVLAIGGIPPYTFSAGFNPFKGLTIASNGIITGTPTLTHSGTWELTVTDATLTVVTYQLPLKIQAVPTITPIHNPIYKDTGIINDSSRSIDDLFLDYAAIIDNSVSLFFGSITPDLLRIIDTSYSTFTIDGGGS